MYLEDKDTWKDVLKRVEELEKRAIGVADLPLKRIRLKLEDAWAGSGSLNELILRQSVRHELLEPADAAVEIGYGTGWSARGAGYDVPRIYKDPYGRVHLSGSAQSNGTGVLIENSNNKGIPGPIGAEKFLVASLNGPVEIEVWSDGQIRRTAAVSEWVSLSGISWRAKDS